MNGDETNPFLDLAKPKDDENPFAQFSAPKGTPMALTVYTPGKGDPKMEGGFETSSGKPMHTLESFLRGLSPYVTVAVHPDSPLLGKSFNITLGNKMSFPAKATDTGPGVRSIDIASEMGQWGKKAPSFFSNAVVSETPTEHDENPFLKYAKGTGTETSTASRQETSDRGTQEGVHLRDDAKDGLGAVPPEAQTLQVDSRARSVPIPIATQSAPQEFPSLAPVASPIPLPAPDDSYADLIKHTGGDKPIFRVTPEQVKLAFSMVNPDAARQLGAMPFAQNAVNGLSQSTASLLSGVSTPNNIVMLGAMIMLPELTGVEWIARAASLGISAASAKQIWDGVKNFNAQPGSVEWWKDLGDIVFNVGMGTLTGIHALGPRTSIPEKITDKDLESNVGIAGRPRAQEGVVAQLEAINRSLSNVTDATIVPDPASAPEKAPGTGRWFIPQAGKRLIKTPFTRWLGNWNASRQIADGAGMELSKALVRAVPDKARREAIYNWAAAGGDETTLKRWINEAPDDVKEGYRDALTLSQHEKNIGKAVREGYDQWLARARDLGMLDEGVTDYMKRIVTKRPEVGEEKVRGLFRTGNRLNTSFPEARKRFWDAMVDAEKTGVRYNKDLGTTTFSYARSFSHAAVDRAAVAQLFDTLTEDGRPMVIVEGQGIRVGEEGNTALLVTPYGVRRFPGQAAEAKRLLAAHPEWSEAKANSIARDKIRQEYVKLDGVRALRDWQWVENLDDGTAVMVRGEAMVHKSVAPMLKQKFARERIDWLDQFVVRPIAKVKGSKLSLSIFHDVHERVNAAGHLVNSANVRPLSELMQNKDLRYGMQNGLQLFNGRADAAMFGEAMAGQGWIESVPGIGKWMGAYKDLLFEDQIPRYKAEMYLKALERNRRRYGDPKWYQRKGTQLNEEQLATITAKEANATFGEQNYRQMVGRISGDPVFWQFMQGIFLAPDFGISKLQHIGQAFTPYGGEQRMALATVAAMLYTGARFLNQLLDNDPHFEPEHAFAVVVGDRTYSIRSLPGDLQHLWSSPATYAYHRMSFATQIALESLTKRDLYGRPVGWSDVVKDLLLTPVPITLTAAAEKILPWGKESRYDMKDMAFNALGLSVNIYKDEAVIKKMARDWKMQQPELRAQIERNQGAVYPPNKYDNLRNALANDDFNTARIEYQNLLAEGGKMTRMYLNTAMKKWSEAPLATGTKKLEPAFLKTLNARQRERYDSAREERRRVYRNFQLMNAQ